MSDRRLDVRVPSATNLSKEQAVVLCDEDFVGQGEVVERRQRLRFGVDISVRVITQGPTKTVACEGRGTDLNGGGLAVRVEIDLEVGAQIAVEFAPPYTDQPIAFRCFVRNCDGNRYGVEFITENDEDYRKAGELQERLAAMQPSGSQR